MSELSPTACAIIVAGGIGARAANGSQLPKQLQKLGNKPVIAWSIAAFAGDKRFGAIIVVCPPDMQSFIQEHSPQADLIFAPSGETRTASVRSGLARARLLQPSFIFIHDAARPGLQQTTLDDLFDALATGASGSAPTLMIGDALWHQDDQWLSTSQDRGHLLRVQTPQAFVAADILAAYDGLDDKAERPDDVAVARHHGLRVKAVAGCQTLDKITWPEDFKRMAALLQTTLLPRTGTGFDAHRFGVGDHVTLCGVAIAHTHGLAGHSDADVAWHALADAIYGALGAGDIGQHFPPSDMAWKGAPSSVFLKHAADLVKSAGGLVNHVDLTLICEQPRIGPHRTDMIETTAALLGLRQDQVSIKATTTEGMGFTGRQEGIAAQASATVLLPETYRGMPKSGDAT